MPQQLINNEYHQVNGRVYSELWPRIDALVSSFRIFFCSFLLVFQVFALNCG